MKKSALAALAAALLLVVSACGSSTPAKPKLSADEKAAASQIAQAFRANGNNTLTEEEANCFAEGFVGSTGLQKLKDAKLLTESGTLNPSTGVVFTKELAGKFADAFLGCVDYQKRLAESLAKADPTVDQAALETCLKKDLPTAFVRDLIVAAQTQSSDAAKLGEESTKRTTACKQQSATATPSPSPDSSPSGGASSAPSSSPSAG